MPMAAMASPSRADIVHRAEQRQVLVRELAGLKARHDGLQQHLQENSLAVDATLQDATIDKAVLAREVVRLRERRDELRSAASHASGRGRQGLAFGDDDRRYQVDDDDDEDFEGGIEGAQKRLDMLLQESKRLRQEQQDLDAKAFRDKSALAMEVQKLRTEVTASKARCESLRARVAQGVVGRSRLEHSSRSGGGNTMADDEEADEDERLELGGGGDKSKRETQLESERILHHLIQFDEGFLKRFTDVKKSLAATSMDQMPHGDGSGDDMREFLRASSLRIGSIAARLDSMRTERPIHSHMVAMLRDHVAMRVRVNDYSEGLMEQKLDQAQAPPSERRTMASISRMCMP